jgi:hypothetical protein
VFGIVFLHDCDGATRTCGVSSPIPRVEFHNIGSGRDREMSDGFMAIEGEYREVVRLAAEQERTVVL